MRGRILGRNWDKKVFLLDIHNLPVNGFNSPHPSKIVNSVTNDKIPAGKMAAINRVQYHPLPFSFSV
jgi:hypothetical protein